MARDRWQFVWDMNGDGVFTISDLSKLVGWLVFLPGDGLIYLVVKYTPALAVFLEFSEEMYGGWLSGIASAVIWSLCLFYLMGVLSVVAEAKTEIERVVGKRWTAPVLAVIATALAVGALLIIEVLV